MHRQTSPTSKCESVILLIFARTEHMYVCVHLIPTDGMFILRVFVNWSTCTRYFLHGVKNQASIQRIAHMQYIIFKILWCQHQQ